MLLALYENPSPYNTVGLVFQIKICCESWALFCHDEGAAPPPTLF